MWLSEEKYNKALVALYKGDCRLSILASRMRVSKAHARNATYQGDVLGHIEEKRKAGAEIIYGLTAAGMEAAVAVTTNKRG